MSISISNFNHNIFVIITMTIGKNYNFVIITMDFRYDFNFIIINMTPSHCNFIRFIINPSYDYNFIIISKSCLLYQTTIIIIITISIMINVGNFFSYTISSTIRFFYNHIMSITMINKCIMSMFLVIVAGWLLTIRYK